MSNFRPQGNFVNQGQPQFNQQQQFNPNQQMNNPNMRPQQMPGNQNFQGGNNMQGQVQQMNRGGNMMNSNAPKNDWDQFFQQTNVPNMSNNQPMNNNQGFNNNQMVNNDQAANLLLRNALLQGNSAIDPSLKQSLARTVGLVGGNNNVGMNNNNNNNMMNMQQMQGRGNVGMNNPNQGGNMNMMMNRGNNMMNSNNFDDSYNPFDNQNNQRGGNNFQSGFNNSGNNSNNNFMNDNDMDFGNNNNNNNSNTGVNPLDVLNKLNNIVAATGGGMSRQQQQRALQNPNVGARDMSSQGGNVRNMGGGGGSNFSNQPNSNAGANFSSGPGLQMPQHRGGHDMGPPQLVTGPMMSSFDNVNASRKSNNPNLTGMRSNNNQSNSGRDNFQSNNNSRSNFDVPPNNNNNRNGNNNNNNSNSKWTENDDFGGRSGNNNNNDRIGKRTRDYSPAYSRSNSPQYKRSNQRSPPRGSNNNNNNDNYNRSNQRSPPRNNRPTPQQITSNTPFDYWSATQTRLIEDYNAPAITKNVHTLTCIDLNTKFPNLYVPTDFMNIGIDWKSITDSIYNDKICQISDGVPFVFENTPAPLVAEATSSVDTPIYTYLTANTINNALVNNYTNYSRFHCSNVRPVKFNARVIVTLGIPNHQSERIDFNLPRKLRVLCGRRKGHMMLLGSSWSYELDGGDPMQDRSCLLNTARRAVFSQSLLDIFNPERGGNGFDTTSNLTKLCEINYHRPKEELNGKQYPEQEEITAIFLYTMQPDALPANQKGLDTAWKIFNDRVKGLSVGPTLNKNVDDYLEEVLSQPTPAVTTNAPTSPAVVATPTEVKAEGSDSDPSIQITIDRSGSESDTAAPTAEVETTPPVVETAPAAPAAATSGVEMQKPDSPTLFICPAPLHKDAEATKKNEAVSLRVTPLSSILGYSHDDRNERLFETAIAGEIVRSLIGVSNANIIVDFFLAEHPVLSSLADIRVVESIKVLREIVRLMRLEIQASKGNASDGAANGNVTAASPAKPVTAGVSAAEVKPESIAGDVAAEAITETNSSEATADSMKTEDSTVAETKQDGFQVEVSEQEARMWRRRFIGACRWFDTNGDKFFTRDLTQLIIYSSTRNMSKADVNSLLDRVCRGGRVNYENFL